VVMYPSPDLLMLPSWLGWKVCASPQLNHHAQANPHAPVRPAVCSRWP
jgi:hypothetical protein